jgi:hypothetical protein
VGLSNILAHLREHQLSYRALKTGLLFAWKNGWPEQELLLYDLMGKAQLALGNYPASKELHDKFSQALLEPPHSILRKRAAFLVSKLQDSVRFSPEPYLRICKLLVNHLNLPVRPASALPLLWPQSVRALVDKRANLEEGLCLASILDALREDADLE